MEPIFANDSYDTPETTPRHFIDRLFGNSRFYFYWRYSRIVWHAGRLAKRGRYDDTEWNKSSHAIFREIEACGGRFHIRGLDHIRSSPQPKVFVSNHMSTLETMIFPCIINPLCRTTFIVKKALVDMPVFGHVMRSRRPVLVGRQSPRHDLETVLVDGSARLASGLSLVIFPQSTRREVFNPEQFNSLGVKLARRAGVPVVPVAIKTDFWGNGRWLKDFGPLRRQNPIHMSFGAPITVSGNGRAEHERIVDFITQNLRQWHEASHD